MNTILIERAHRLRDRIAIAISSQELLIGDDSIVDSLISEIEWLEKVIEHRDAEIIHLNDKKRLSNEY